MAQARERGELSYLPVNKQATFQQKLQGAYDRPTYAKAKAALSRIRSELSLLNGSAVASLNERLAETLTLRSWPAGASDSIRPSGYLLDRIDAAISPTERLRIPDSSDQTDHGLGRDVRPAQVGHAHSIRGDLAIY